MKISASLGGCFFLICLFFILSARMVHCCVVLLRCPLQPALTLVVTPRLRRGPGERDGGSAPQRDGEVMVAALREPRGGWTAGWSTLDAPLPTWHGWASRSVPGSFRRGARASQQLCTSAQVWRVKLGEGWQNPTGCGLLCSKHPAAAFPSYFLPLFTARSKMSSLFATLLPPSTFAGQRDGEGGFRLFVRGSRKAAFQTGCWLVFHPAPPSTEGLFCHLGAAAISAPPCSTARPGASREKEPQKGAERIETRR